MKELCNFKFNFLVHPALHANVFQFSFFLFVPPPLPTNTQNVRVLHLNRCRKQQHTSQQNFSKWPKQKKKTANFDDLEGNLSATRYLDVVEFKVGHINYNDTSGRVGSGGFWERGKIFFI